MNHLKIPNIGGGAWSELKFDDNKFPSLAALQEAPLWKLKDLYSASVWSWLCSNQESWPATSATSLTTQQGDVCRVEVQVGDRAEKLLVGPLGAILNSRTEAHLLWTEVGVQENFWPEELEAAITHLCRQKGGFRVVLWGTADAIAKAQYGPVAKLTSVGGVLQGYRTRFIAAYIPRMIHCR